MNPNRNPVGWFEIYVQNLDRAKTFYQKTFEITLERLDGTDLEMWVFPMLPNGAGCPGAIVKMDGKGSGAGGTIIYFSCDDCAVESERASKAGGSIVRGKFSIGKYGFIAFIHDTEGNLIGLHSMR
jgi:hypothetical protein